MQNETSLLTSPAVEHISTNDTTLLTEDIQASKPIPNLELELGQKFPVSPQPLSPNQITGTRPIKRLDPATAFDEVSLSALKNPLNSQENQSLNPTSIIGKGEPDTNQLPAPTVHHEDNLTPSDPISLRQQLWHEQRDRHLQFIEGKKLIRQWAPLLQQNPDNWPLPDSDLEHIQNNNQNHNSNSDLDRIKQDILQNWFSQHYPNQTRSLEETRRLWDDYRFELAEKLSTTPDENSLFSAISEQSQKQWEKEMRPYQLRNELMNETARQLFREDDFNKTDISSSPSLASSPKDAMQQPLSPTVSTAASEQNLIPPNPPVPQRTKDVFKTLKENLMTDEEVAALDDEPRGTLPEADPTAPEIPHPKKSVLSENEIRNLIHYEMPNKKDDGTQSKAIALHNARFNKETGLIEVDPIKQREKFLINKRLDRLRPTFGAMVKAVKDIGNFETMGFSDKPQMLDESHINGIGAIYAIEDVSSTLAALSPADRDFLFNLLERYVIAEKENKGAKSGDVDDFAKSFSRGITQPLLDIKNFRDTLSDNVLIDTGASIARMMGQNDYADILSDTAQKGRDALSARQRLRKIAEDRLIPTKNNEDWRGELKSPRPVSFEMVLDIPEDGITPMLCMFFPPSYVAYGASRVGNNAALLEGENQKALDNINEKNDPLSDENQLRSLTALGSGTLRALLESGMHIKALSKVASPLTGLIQKTPVFQQFSHTLEKARNIAPKTTDILSNTVKNTPDVMAQNIGAENDIALSHEITRLSYLAMKDGVADDISDKLKEEFTPEKMTENAILAMVISFGLAALPHTTGLVPKSSKKLGLNSSEPTESLPPESSPKSTPSPDLSKNPGHPIIPEPPKFTIDLNNVRPLETYSHEELLFIFRQKYNQLIKKYKVPSYDIPSNPYAQNEIDFSTPYKDIVSGNPSPHDKLTTQEDDLLYELGMFEQSEEAFQDYLTRTLKPRNLNIDYFAEEKRIRQLAAEKRLSLKDYFWSAKNRYINPDAPTENALRRLVFNEAGLSQPYLVYTPEGPPLYKLSKSAIHDNQGPLYRNWEDAFIAWNMSEKNITANARFNALSPIRLKKTLKSENFSELAEMDKQFSLNVQENIKQWAYRHELLEMNYRPMHKNDFDLIKNNVNQRIKKINTEIFEDAYLYHTHITPYDIAKHRFTQKWADILDSKLVSKQEAQEWLDHIQKLRQEPLSDQSLQNLAYSFPNTYEMYHFRSPSDATIMKSHYLEIESPHSALAKQLADLSLIDQSSSLDLLPELFSEPFHLTHRQLEQAKILAEYLPNTNYYQAKFELRDDSDQAFYHTLSEYLQLSSEDLNTYASSFLKKNKLSTVAENLAPKITKELKQKMIYLDKVAYRTKNPFQVVVPYIDENSGRELYKAIYPDGSTSRLYDNYYEAFIDWDIQSEKIKIPHLDAEGRKITKTVMDYYEQVKGSKFQSIHSKVEERLVRDSDLNSPEFDYYYDTHSALLNQTEVNPNKQGFVSASNNEKPNSRGYVESFITIYNPATPFSIYEEHSEAVWRTYMRMHRELEPEFTNTLKEITKHTDIAYFTHDVNTISKRYQQMQLNEALSELSHQYTYSQYANMDIPAEMRSYIGLSRFFPHKVIAGSLHADNAEKLTSKILGKGILSRKMEYVLKDSIGINHSARLERSGAHFNEDVHARLLLYLDRPTELWEQLKPIQQKALTDKYTQLLGYPDSVHPESLKSELFDYLKGFEQRMIDRPSVKQWDYQEVYESFVNLADKKNIVIDHYTDILPKRLPNTYLYPSVEPIPLDKIYLNASERGLAFRRLINEGAYPDFFKELVREHQLLDTINAQGQIVIHPRLNDYIEQRGFIPSEVYQKIGETYPIAPINTHPQTEGHKLFQDPLYRLDVKMLSAMRRIDELLPYRTKHGVVFQGDLYAPGESSSLPGSKEEWNSWGKEETYKTFYETPAHPGHNITIDPGNQYDPDALTQNPYVRHTYKGHFLDKNMNPVLPHVRESYIPLEEFQFQADKAKELEHILTEIGPEYYLNPLKDTDSLTQSFKGTHPEGYYLADPDILELLNYLEHTLPPKKYKKELDELFSLYNTIDRPRFMATDNDFTEFSKKAEQLLKKLEKKTSSRTKKSPSP